MNETANTTDLLYSRLGTDPDLGELVDMFVEEMPGRVAALLEQFQAGNLDGLRQSAHQMKGAAGSYGFDALSPAAGRLESSLRDEEPLEQVRVVMQELIDLCNRVRAGAPG